MLRNGHTYTFTATAVNGAGRTVSTRSAPVTAQNRPLTPRIPLCRNGGFGCYVSNNCTGGIRFTWPSTTPPSRAATHPANTYVVRAYLQTQAAHVQEWKLSSPMIDATDLDWAIGAPVSFAVQSVDPSNGWASDWSQRSPPVLMPGVPTLPTLSFEPLVDSVAVSWDPGAVAWHPGETLKRFRLEGSSMRGSVARDFCMLRACAALGVPPSAPVDTPIYCANRVCNSFTIANTPVLKSLPTSDRASGVGGVLFTVRAEGQFHSNCATTHALEAAVWPVTPPDPPVQVQAHSVYGSGAITATFPPSRGFDDAPILRYVVDVIDKATGAVVQSAVLQTRAVADAAVSGEWLEQSFGNGQLTPNVEYTIAVAAQNAIGSSGKRSSADAVVIAPVDADPTALVDEAMAGKVPATIVTMQFILPGVRPAEVNSTVRRAYIAAVAETIGLLPAYVRITNVTTVACDNRDCTSVGNIAAGRARRQLSLATAQTATVLHTKAVIPDTNVQSGAQAEAVQSYASTDAMVDGLTARLQATGTLPPHFYSGVFVHGVLLSSPGGAGGSGGAAAGGGAADVWANPYAAAFIIIGVSVTVIGLLMATVANQRIKAASKQGGAAAVAAKSTQSARKPGRAEGLWTRASIRSPLQPADIKETSFFEKGGDDADLDSLEDEAPADFINPALTANDELDSPGPRPSGVGSPSRSSRLGFGRDSSKSHLGARRSQQGGSVLGARRSQLGRDSSKSHLGTRRSATAAQQQRESVSQQGEGGQGQGAGAGVGGLRSPTNALSAISD